MMSGSQKNSYSYDEWKPKELVQLASEQAGGEGDEEELVNEQSSVTTIQRFTLYQELSSRIKTSLNAHGKASPVVTTTQCVMETYPISK